MTEENSNALRYGLQLSDGSQWELTGDESVSGWLAELAHIMSLGPCLRRPSHAIHFHGVKALDLPAHELAYLLPGSSRSEWQPFKNSGIQRVWRHGERPDIHVELREAFLEHEEIRYINMWSTLREVHRHALLCGGTPMHATLAALDGQGVLIAGEGGAGKSTCHSRLPDDWEKLCDDQCLVLRMADGTFRVHPLPTWSDYLWRGSQKQCHVEHSVSLKAAFFLEQAQEDVAIPLTNPADAILKYLDAAKQVWQPLWSRIAAEEKRLQSTRLFSNVSWTAGAIPAFRLKATLHGEFWKEIESWLSSIRLNPAIVSLAHCLPRRDNGGK